MSRHPSPTGAISLFPLLFSLYHLYRTSESQKTDSALSYAGVNPAGAGEGSGTSPSVIPQLCSPTAATRGLCPTRVGGRQDETLLHAPGDAGLNRHSFPRHSEARAGTAAVSLRIFPWAVASPHPGSITAQQAGPQGRASVLIRAPLGSVGGEAREGAEWAHTQRFAFAQQQAVYPDCASINRGLCSPYVWI